MNTVQIKTYEAPKFNINEAARYALADKNDVATRQLILSLFEEIKDKLSYKVCYTSVPVKITENCIDFEFAKVTSSNLSKTLFGCEKAVISALTLGFEIDRMIAKYNIISPAKAVIFQGIGSERAEALCETFNNEIKNEAKSHNEICTPRFSPGYGDCPLEFQKEIFRLLNCPKNIGLSLNSGLLMSPSKSVTTIIGIKRK